MKTSTVLDIVISISWFLITGIKVQALRHGYYRQEPRAFVVFEAVTAALLASLYAIEVGLALWGAP